MFDHDWSQHIEPLASASLETELSPSFDFQQDLLESQHLTGLFDATLQGLPPDAHDFLTPFENSSQFYASPNEFTQSSPALVSSPSTRHPTRALPRRKSRYGLYQAGRRGVSIPQPLRQLDERRERFNTFETPLERWQNSPPDSEPAPIEAIHQEYERKLLQSSVDTTDVHLHGEIWTAYRTPSRANSATGSEASEISALSTASERSSASRRARRVSQKRKSRSKKQLETSEASEAQRIFKCTFCCDSFKHKYDWARHEKSLHLSIGGWRCSPFGGVVQNPSLGRSICTFCNILDPSAEHIETHNYQACLKTIGKSHVFQRKDHLMQHLRLVHRLEATPLIEDWKVQMPQIRSRCGFCNTKLTSWDERTEHLAAHFRNGLSMEDWQGGHDFEDRIAAQVNNSLPPWYIKSESKTLIPFSATNSASRDQYRQHLASAARLGNSIPSTELETSHEGTSSGFGSMGRHQPEGQSFELLASHLSRFAREQMALGKVPTDEMFQMEARKLFYEDVDEWNQTVADDTAWLSAFRQQNDWHVSPNS